MHIRKYLEILGVMPILEKGFCVKHLEKAKVVKCAFFQYFPKTCFGRQTGKVVMWSGDLSLG